MNIEKVKEIKKALEFQRDSLVYLKDNVVEYMSCKEILTLINELESENAYKQEHIEMWFRKNEEKKKRIAELEKEIEENAFYSKGYAQGIKNTYEVVVPEKLKQFAERLKNYIDENQVQTTYFGGKCFIDKETIDETLKEFIENV